MSFFATPVVDEWGTTYELTTAGYTVLVIAMLAILLIGCAIFGSKKKFSAKQLSFSAMGIALAMVTSILKLWNMPMGGSVTLFSMLFIVLIGHWYGLGVGLSTALAYGILQLLIDPYIISVPQMLLDYVFAFGALGLSGLFSKSSKRLIPAYLVGVFGRFVFATLSGYIFFPTFMPEYFNSAIIYSICYNGAYIGAEAILTLILIALPPVNKALAHVKTLAS
jgi:thiamine transporter